MRLRAQIGAFPFLHMIMCLVQLMLIYLLSGSGVSTYGGSEGFLAYTPLAYMTAGDVQGGQPEAANFKSLFDFVLRLGDTVWGILAFNYEFLTMVKPADRISYGVVFFLRVIAWLSTLVFGEALAEMVFRSGVLGSTIGTAVVVGIVVIVGILAVLGIVF